MDEKVLINGEPEVGSIYGVEELSSILKELEKYSTELNYKPYKTIKKFEDKFSGFVGTKYAVSVNSGMSALNTILQAFFGDRKGTVISNAINFSGTHIGILNKGYRLILCESDENINTDLLDLFHKVEEYKPEAVVLTNMNGLSHDEKYINQEIKRISPNTIFITDCCRSLGSKCNYIHCGVYSDASFFSFQRKKMISTLGEGGMIVTNDSSIYEKCKKIRSFGYFEGEGENFKLTSFQAAVGLVQLDKLNDLVNKRRQISLNRTDFLKKHLRGWVYPVNNEIDYNSFYLYTLLAPVTWASEQRDNLIALLLKKYGIGCVVANKVTYESSSWVRKNTQQRLTKSETISNRIICPIIHPILTNEQENYINESILKSIEEVENNEGRICNN
ncbi:hypothetical protein CKN86_01280 [Carnobacterium divergens]|uniref:DegT/DnrJ/EryC1/StrS family aminotransferase n=1 Tax=Carnobacterium divergens TaxID=2748 RepID=UPI000D489362|nr:DegT/DnrJ/EryC1/StrS family aminotransferase [Carnobacterium divergens]MCO6018462.1 DegT/DnrJ/EryC1/StrS family aminotransferase [Carnobacterium divergens]TFI65214.1 hypothetical protein CKN62_01280 [Carnobacterium divergens]TFI92104.1 hypothetical protein CKN84_01280 [Carnobacterium divergens]TFJ07327.1 hypothetical protein CKN86_01280 [Carnobacterium divergens]TFJ08558.1 hypothetical protein CKN65_01280 [Carnobacterium divergens]